jgi:hypothetical protein
LTPRQSVHFPIDAAATRWNGAAAFMPARLKIAGAPDGAVKTAKAQMGRDYRLQSLLQMSHGSARSARRGEAMLAEAVRVP